MRLSNSLPWLVLGLSCAGAIVLLSGPNGWSRLSRLRQERARVSGETLRVSSEIARLRARARAARTDLTEIERVAWERLGWVRKSEVVVALEPAGKPPR